LIECQRPDATLVAGYRKRPELGRHVVKGAKAIQIFAPVTRKLTDKSDTAEASEPASVRRIVGFRLASVFDPSSRVFRNS
jgi:hypothetical protein